MQYAGSFLMFFILQYCFIMCAVQVCIHKKVFFINTAWKLSHSIGNNRLEITWRAWLCWGEKPKQYTVVCGPHQIYDALFLGVELWTPLLNLCWFRVGHITVKHKRTEAQGKRSGMWLVSVLVPLLKLYFCGIRVLIYQMLNKAFILPGLVNLHFLEKNNCQVVFFLTSMLNENASLKRIPLSRITVFDT